MTDEKLNYNNDNHRQQQSGSGNQYQQNERISFSPNRNLKKTESFMKPVYKLVGINNEPSSKEIKTLIAIGIIAIIFMISMTGFFVMWFTEFYNNALISRLILEKDSEAATWWIRPPVGTHLKVHIFNYTNIERFVKGLDKKLILKDLGPYTYGETSTKVNVSFNNNYTVTFKEYRTHKFLDSDSKGTEDDAIYVPNVPALTALKIHQSADFFTKAGITSGLALTNSKPFVKLAAKEFLWGYKDAFLSTTSLVGFSLDKFGILMNRKGISKDTFQIHTGEDDAQKLGLISQFNGIEKLDYWLTDECNAINASDGGQFPPHLMNKSQKLDVFLPALCRKVKLEFSNEVQLFDGVEVWRYRTANNVFSNPDINPENACYCDKRTKECPTSGVHNGLQCYDNAPIYPSFPHFYAGDPILWSKFEGIKPIQELHQTYADLHPRLGFPINGASRVQINIKLIKNYIFKDNLNHFDDGMILPLIWLEITTGQLDEEIRTLIFHSTFSANAIQTILKYGTLLISISTFTLIVVGVYFFSKIKEKKFLYSEANQSEKNIEMIKCNAENTKNAIKEDDNEENYMLHTKTNMARQENEYVQAPIAQNIN